MFLFGGASWVPRFWPAIAGSMLVVCLPLFKSQIGKVPALILAFLLVFDPAMLAISQQAGSIGLAILFVFLFIQSMLRRKPTVAGIAGGMALLSGPDMWPGVIGIGLAYFASRRLDLWADKAKSEDDLPGARKGFSFGDFEWRKLLSFLLGNDILWRHFLLFLSPWIERHGGGIVKLLAWMGKCKWNPCSLICCFR